MARYNWSWFVLLTVVLIGSGDFASLSVAQSLSEKLIAEDPNELANQAVQDGDIVRGAILFHQGNIHCSRCHRPTDAENRIGPNLSRLGEEVTNASIVESILQPSKQLSKGYETYNLLTVDGRTISGTKVSEDANQIVIRDSANDDRAVVILRDDIDQIRPGKISTMPADLADQLKSRQQFLDLVRYVIDMKQRGPELESDAAKVSASRQLSPELKGLVLIQKLNCTACHASDSSQLIAVKKAPHLKWSAANLNPEYIQSFIANPHGVKPGTTMPDLFEEANPDERESISNAITHFLVSKVENTYEKTAVNLESARRGFEAFQSVGCVACHSPRDETATEKWLEQSAPLGNLAKKHSVEGLARFLEDPLAARPSGHMPNMRLSHFEAVDIANFLLQAEQTSESKFEFDPQLAKEGKLLFTKHNCSSCHTEMLETPARAVQVLALKKLNPQNGCLSADGGGGPNFQLNEQDRSSIVAAIQNFPKNLDTQQKIDITLDSYNCVACHQRQNLGGVSVERNPHFHTTNLNLGDQGRIPPTLTGVGAKLNRKWMRDVMVNGRSIRPYMKTRMPQFGEQNIQHLFELFEATDHLEDTKFAAFEDQKAMREKGHLLAGNKGLNCVACHTYQFKVSDTMPAVDLTEMSERLKKDWFYQYMLAPQKFSPNTVMPSFWPGGNAIRTDIEGSPEDQIEALWQYLIDGRQARAPSGVVRKPLEIVVTDEAQMLRRKYPGIGKRGIGVGYPGGVNIAFDAEQLRLGSVWRGPFAEASGVWRGQGSGNVRPLGQTFEFAKGPELDHIDNPWVVDDGRPPNHQFKGYTLDSVHRPTFMYRFGAIKVEDFFFQMADDPDAPVQLRRSLNLQSEKPQDGIRFRIATGPAIAKADDAYFIDEKLSVRVVSKHSAEISDLGPAKVLQVPIQIGPNDPQTLVIEYILK